MNWTSKFGGTAGDGVAGYGGSKTHKIIVHPTTGKVYATGILSRPGDNIRRRVKNNNGDSVDLFQRDKDIFLIALTPGTGSNVNSVTQNYLRSFNKTSLNYNTAQHHNESGPFTARTMLTAPANARPTENSTAKSYLYEGVNKDERGYDLEFTQDGNIALVGLVNVVLPYDFAFGNGASLFTNGITGFHDGGRTADNPDGYYFDFYSDGDAYLLKVQPSNGTLIWSKNVAHFSSREFYPQLFQNGRGNYIIAGSTADYYNPATDRLKKPWSYDGLVMEVPDNATGDYLWRRTVKGGWNSKDKYVAGQEPNLCLFGLAPTADGGFVVCGDNTRYDANWQSTHTDYFSVNKLSPYCIDTNALSIDSRHYAITGTVNWPSSAVPNGAKIAGKVVVEPGATLNITNATLYFASSDHYHDYFHWSPGVNDTGHEQISGIVVRPGGKLVIKNSTPKGMDDCQSASPTDRYMWDGIIVDGQPKEPRSYAKQGVLEIADSRIEDARYGTLVDYGFRHIITENTVVNNYDGATGSTRYDATGTHGGGIVKATNSIWKDCRFSVNYQRFAGTPTALGGSFYNGCSFLATEDGMADPCFYASPTGSRLPSSTFLASWDAGRISVNGVTFNCHNSFPQAQWPVGIVGDDGSYAIGLSGATATSFTNLNTGVRLTMTPGQSTRYNLITGAVFQNNLAGIDVANSLNGLTITKSQFSVPAYAANALGPGQHIYPTGIRLQASSGYNVSLNTMNKVSGSAGRGYGGIQVSWGSSYKNLDNAIRFNSFNNIVNPSIALQVNSSATGEQGLQWVCNDYLSGNAYAINRISKALPPMPSTVVPATMRANQGDCNSINSSPVENRFYTNCAGGPRLNADNYTTQTVNYYYDATPSRPELDPVCFSNQYNAAQCVIQQTQAQFCDPNKPDVAVTDKNVALAMLATISNDKNSQTADTALWYDLQTREHLLVSSLCRYHASLSQPDSAGNLLMTYQRPTEALPFYMEARNWTAAENAWNALPSATTEDNQYRQLTRMAIDLYKTGKSWMDANDDMRSVLMDISNSNTWTGSLALATAGLLGLKTYQWPTAAGATTDMNGLARRTNTDGSLTTVTTAENASGFRIYPNPTTGALYLESDKGGEAVLYNLTGTKIWGQRIGSGKTVVQLPQALAAGMYLVRFVAADGAVSQTRLTYQP